MSINDFHFVTHWRVKGTEKEVLAILADLENYPTWWPSVYLAVNVEVPQVLYGMHTKGWLPYSMVWQIAPVWNNFEKLYPHFLMIRASGDFVGRGVWLLLQEGDFVEITYDWRITAQKPLLKYLSYVPGLKIIFGANHRWAMRQGERGLVAELVRRRAQTVTMGVNYD
jgi:hypothetical protein